MYITLTHIDLQCRQHSGRFLFVACNKGGSPRNLSCLGYDLTDVVGLPPAAAPAAPAPTAHVNDMQIVNEDDGVVAQMHGLDDHDGTLGEVLAHFDLVGDDFAFDTEDAFFSGLGL